MAKELPYFKFEPNAWDNGNIQMLSREDKGLFIDICSMYWSRLGDLPVRLVVQKLCSGNSEAINDLIEEDIIQIKNSNIQICFLNKQLSDFNLQSKVNSENAKSRWETVPERMKGNIVYVIRCWNEKEEFIKIGITSTSISRRFSGKMPYNYEVLVVDYYESIELESQYKEVAKEYEYITTESFSGYFECYKIDAIPSIMQFAKIRNAKYMRNQCETNAIREEEIRVDKIIEDKEGEILNSDKPDKIPEPEERKKVAQKKEIEYPFPTKEFKAGWDLWKAYRKKKDKFQYFDEESEQKALTELFNLSKKDQAAALAIIRQSIDKGWKGFFELKTTTNGHFKPTNGNLTQARRR